MSEVIRQYQADFGTWYAQVKLTSGAVVEFAFDHEPAHAEIDMLVTAMETPDAPVVTVEAEDGSTW